MAVASLKVDGSAAQNDFLMQFQADALGIPVERPVILNATAQGTAFGSGLASGFWDDYEALIARRKLDRVFEPGREAQRIQDNYKIWQKTLERAKNWVD